MKKILCIFLAAVLTVTPIHCIRLVSNASRYQASKVPINQSRLQNNETENEVMSVNTLKNSKEVAVSSTSRVVNAATTNILLVNRSNRLEKDYIPQSLKFPNVKFISYADPKVKKMDAVAAVALEELFKAAKSDGITLLAVSGYREYSYQQRLYNDKVSSDGQKEADKYVAQAGASEHQTGLAMDLLSTEYTSLDDGFDKTRAYKWLEKNCYKYGFIIRYPKDKERITGYSYEPWHIRYVGENAAAEITEQGITLEEFLNKTEL